MPQNGHGRSIHTTHKVSELPAKFVCARAWTATQQFARGEPYLQGANLRAAVALKRNG